MPGHRDCIVKFTSIGIVDRTQRAVQPVPVGDLLHHQPVRRKIRGIQKRPCIAPVKADPFVTPRVLLIRLIADLHAGKNDEHVSGRKRAFPVPHGIRAFSARDIVDQKMVTDTGTPFIAGCTLLPADIVDRQSHHRFFPDLVADLESLHAIPHVFYETACSIPEDRTGRHVRSLSFIVRSENSSCNKITSCKIEKLLWNGRI